MPFYEQEGISPGAHSLTINLQNGTFFKNNKGGQSTCIFVDYFEYTPLPDSKRNDTGIIVGIVLSAIAICVACLCALLFWRRIKRTKQTITVLQNRAPDEKWDTRSGFSGEPLPCAEYPLLKPVV